MIERFVELCKKLLRCRPLIMLKEILHLLNPLECTAQECWTENYIALSKIIPLISYTLTKYKNISQTTKLSMKLKEAILIELQRFNYRVY